MAWQDFLQNNSLALLNTGAGLLTGNNAQEQAANGFKGFAQGMNANKTMQFLSTQHPELAQAVGQGILSPAEAYKLSFEYKTKTAQDTAEEQRWMNRQKAVWEHEASDPNNALDQEYKRAQIQALSAKGDKAGQDEWGLSPVWGVDSEGKQVIGQVSKSGKFKPLDTGGITPTPTLQSIDTGTGTLSINSRTGLPVRETQKDILGRERDEKEGAALGEARANLPKVEAAASELIASIDSLANDQYLGNMLGSWDSRTPNFTSDAARVQSKMDQIGGQTFMQAFQTLRGAGQITEQEGAKATAAMARLNTAQTEADYKAALGELRGVATRAVERARTAAAGQGYSPMGSGGSVYKNKYGLE